jgi:hypothetical protein
VKELAQRFPELGDVLGAAEGAVEVLVIDLIDARCARRRSVRPAGVSSSA